MSSVLRKSVAGAIAALTITVGVGATLTPAAADGQTPPRYRYPIYGWRGGYTGWEGPVMAGLIGGFAVTALAGQAYGWAPAYSPAYDYCYWQSRPIYDSWGSVVGDQPAWVCY
jgi:hypothetical protein